VTQLLHISASPRGEASESLALAKAFLQGFTAKNPDVKVEELDLFDGSLPTFGRLAAGAKMAIFAGGQPSPEQTAEWDTARAVFDRFATADTYLFSIPMWNSGLPYVLKQWIDIVTQPGWVFGFSPETGYEGLIKGKRAAVVYVSGVFSPGASLAFGADFHSTYFNDWLRFAGFEESDVVEVRFQPTVLTATPQDDRAAAIAIARSAGQSF
jgi:FMN-dependent NADH-azoreductase